MKAVFYGYRADIIGLLWLAWALFFSLALSSYHPLDPSFNSLGLIAEVRNKCGYLGSFIADLSFQIFGLASWVFVALSLRQVMRAFQKQLFKMEVWLGLGLLCSSLMVCASLLELHQPKKTFFEGHIHAGGILGKTIINVTGPFLHFSGQFLLLWSLALCLLILITKNSVAEIALKIYFACKHVAYKIIFRAILFTKQAIVNLSSNLFYFMKNKLFRIKNGQDETIEALSPLSPLKTKDSLFSPITDEKDYFFKEEKEFDSKNLTTPSSLIGRKRKKSSTGGTTWVLPKTSLLKSSENPTQQLTSQESKMDAERLKKKLKQFSISGDITNIRTGPVITLFEFKPEDHIKIARITQMEDDLMIALKSKSIRIIAPIPGRDVVGIETAHTKRQMVYLKNLVDDPQFWKSEHPLPLVLGRHVDGTPAIRDLGKIPHLMVAGSTGSGKSVFVVSFLLSLLFRHTPDTLRLLLVDPKRVDLTSFEGLPHLLAPPVRESKEAVMSLQWCLNEMYKRYRSLAHFHVRDLASFNEKMKQSSSEEVQKHSEIMESIGESSEESYYFKPQPYICIVLEEFGDLMSSPERTRIESSVVRLAQMARACGMHLILSMQSPRKDVVTGLIKTNIPGRISFKVSSRIDSRIILDEGGAERLLAQGDMLYLGPGQARPERFHGAYIREQELFSIIQFWKQQVEENPYIIKFSPSEQAGFKSGGEDMPLEEQDKKYTEIFAYVSALKEVSASHLQRKYGLGYPRAARLIDRLEEEGVVGPARGSKPREVLVHK